MQYNIDGQVYTLTAAIRPNEYLVETPHEGIAHAYIIGRYVRVNIAGAAYDVRPTEHDGTVGGMIAAGVDAYTMRQNTRHVA